MIKAGASSRKGPATQRMDGLIRDIRKVRNDERERALRGQVWPLLLEVANEDIEAAALIVDAHWRSNDALPILFHLYVFDVPGLAQQLGLQFHSCRPGFAAEMLCADLLGSSWQLDKVEGAAFTAVEASMDTSCRLLASWTLDHAQPDVQALLTSMVHLLEFGNPAEAYWPRIPGAALNVIKALDRAGQRNNLRLLAATAFYAEAGSSVASEASSLFHECVARALGRPQGWAGDLASAISDACAALSILEDKSRSYRNRRVAANPGHALLLGLERQLQDVLECLEKSVPEAALSHMVSVALALSNQTLIRQHHRQFIERFEALARQFPGDAGCALKQMTMYCMYSHASDEMYRRHLCQETFGTLVLVLVSISPADAKVAYSGVGWNPRDDYM